MKTAWLATIALYLFVVATVMLLLGSADADTIALIGIGFAILEKPQR